MSATRLEEVLRGQEDNYILPFFWQHGEDEETIRHYMEIIYNANIRAVCVESRPHPDFVGPKWWQDMDVILDEAKKRGMKVWILDDEHFPTGFAAGAVKSAPVELRHQYLDYHRLDICGPKPQVQIAVSNLIHPEEIPDAFGGEKYEPLNDDHLYKVIACPVIREGKLGEPIDLTDRVQDGVVVWDVPKGYYLIFVLYLTRDAKGRNDQINFIDKASCRLQIDAVYEPHWAHYKEEFGKTIAGFFSDEPQIGNSLGYSYGDKLGKLKMALPWSAAVPERMEQAFGSADWTKYLPYLWMDAQDGQLRARIRTVYMDVVSRLIQECFSEQIGSWCEEHGVEYIGHIMEGESSRLGPNLAHFFRCMAGQHMSGVDNIGGCIIIGGEETLREYEKNGWSGEVPFWHYALGKIGASFGAIDPKKKGRCMCENFGAYGWATGVKSFKYFMDFFLARGVNRYVPHAFSMKKFPDPDCPPHFYAHGENPQYKAFGELMAYSNRVCHLISGGISHPVAAVLYHGESDWAGDAFENCAQPARALTTAQIDFHIIPADVYGNGEAYNTRIEPGLFEVNGNRYQMLVAPGCEYLYRETADLLCALMEAGVPVCMTGDYLKGISDCTAEESAAYMERLKDLLFVKTGELAALVREKAVCDVRLDAPYEHLTYYHYTADSDTYFFLNEDTDAVYQGAVTVSATGTPYLYDAWENRVYRIPHEKLEKGTRIRLDIQPLDMAIITFDEAVKGMAEERPAETGESIVVNQFRISLAEAKAYPHFTETELTDSRRSVGLSYPDFSGWIRYESEFETGEGLPEKALLKIDDVFESAEVYVNDVCVGTRVSKPYAYDISSAVKGGKNTLRIDVATTLHRKILAMEMAVSDRGGCEGSTSSPLDPTGILGDVKVYLK